MDSLKVMIIGKVSSGKSSLINSWIGAFISCVSLNRETFSPIIYNLNSEAKLKDAWKLSLQLKDKHEENLKNREELSKIDGNKDKIKNFELNINKLDKNFENIKLPNIFEKNMEVYDCCGLCDSEDKNNVFEKSIINIISKMDIVLFVVDATRAFIDKSELDEYNKIKELINKNRKEHTQYTYLGVIVNKYDDIDDEEIGEIYNKIKDKIGNKEKIYRYSSHLVLSNSIINNGINIPNFMIREMKKILKNSSINIDNALNKRFSENTDIFISSDVFTNKNIENGDWDNLIGNIQMIYKNINYERQEIILNKIKHYCILFDKDQNIL